MISFQAYSLGSIYLASVLWYVGVRIGEWFGSELGFTVELTFGLYIVLDDKYRWDLWLSRPRDPMAMRLNAFFPEEEDRNHE